MTLGTIVLDCYNGNNIYDQELVPRRSSYFKMDQRIDNNFIYLKGQPFGS